MAEYKGANDVVSIDDILDVCGKYITNKDSLTLIKQAYDFIMDKHKDQKRKSGEPYTNHLIWVAYILATLQTGPATITAGLLHDVMEDCNVSHDEMVERFGLEITTLVEGVTKIGKMPFKDEKLDVVVNELSNYDKFEMYRILKPGGYLVVDQLGSDNYKEIINMFIPFKLKGQWNKEACQSTLTEIGFDIVDSYEDVGHIRFHSLSAVLAFMKSISPERVEKYEQFMNFYADVLKKIKKNQFYEITTHKFMVIARKNDMKQEN